jgi:hypothetical protein
MTAAVRSLKFAGAGVRALTCLPTMSHACSIGLRSGSLAGQLYGGFQLCPSTNLRFEQCVDAYCDETIIYNDPVHVENNVFVCYCVGIL